MTLPPGLKHDLSVVAFGSTKQMTMGQRIIVRDALDAVFSELEKRATDALTIAPSKACRCSLCVFLRNHVGEMARIIE